jgi:hypothetical protein
MRQQAREDAEHGERRLVMRNGARLITVVLFVCAWAGWAVAEGDTEPAPITIVGPLEATSCSTTPATITVLGQPIDVSAAAIAGHDDGAIGCAALVVGDTALVQVVPGSAPFKATAVGRPACPFLVPFCPAECHLDSACPMKCHCPGPGRP